MLCCRASSSFKPGAQLAQMLEQLIGAGYTAASGITAATARSLLIPGLLRGQAYGASAFGPLPKCVWTCANGGLVPWYMTHMVAPITLDNTVTMENPYA
jgi:hypothetical protein